MTDLEKLIDEIRESTISLYPSRRSILTLSKHLKKESEELIFAIKCGVIEDINEELSDCLILIFNIAIETEVNASTIIKNVINKLQTCKTRELRKADEDGIIEHKYID